MGRIVGALRPAPTAAAAAAAMGPAAVMSAAEESAVAREGQVAKFHNLQKSAGCENFHNLRNPQAYFAPPKLNTCNKTRPKIIRS